MTFLIKRAANAMGTALLAFTFTAQASATTDTYPNKPVRLLVGMAPGGANDVIARLVSAELANRLGQPFVVENKAGANSTIATNEIKRAAPDGYNLMIVISSHVTNPMLYRNVGYALGDFEYISLVAESAFVLATHPKSGFSGYADVKAATDKDALDFGSPGLGSTQHIAMELMSQMGGITFNHVPYRGGAPAQADLIGGVIPLIFATPAQSLASIRSGQLNALAVTSQDRIAQLPDTPTLAEAGIDGYEATVWFGIVAPKGTPAAIVDKLSTHIAEVVKDKAIVTRFNDLGLSAIGSTPETFAHLIEAEHAKWSEVVEKADISMQ